MSKRVSPFFKPISMFVASSFLITSVFTGCGSSNSGDQGTTGTTAAVTSTAPAETEKSQEKITLTFMTTDQPDVTNEILARYREKAPNVEFNLIELAKDNTQLTTEQTIAKFDTAISSGQVIDLYTTGGGTGVIRPRALNGMLLPLDEYIQKDGIDMEETFIKGSAYTCAFGDPKKWYTLPLARNMYPVYYNKDMFEAAGLPEPTNEWTQDDLMAYAKALTKGEGANKVFGAWIPVDWGWFVGVPAQVGGWQAYKEADGKRVANFDDPDLKKTIQTYYQMSVVDKTNPSATEITMNKLNMVDYFAAGKTAMIVGNGWALGELQKARALGKMNFTMGVAPLPRVTKDTTLDVSASEITGGLSIPKTSAHPYEAYQFMKFLSLECADIIRQLPASSKVDKNLVLKLLGTYVDENGKKYENLFQEDELKNYFDDREGFKSYYQMYEDAYIGPLWGVLGEEMGKILTNAKSIDDGIKDMTTRGQQEIAKIDASSN